MGTRRKSIWFKNNNSTKAQTCQQSTVTISIILVISRTFVNGDCFQAFLDSFAQSEHFHIIQLDNAGFHTVKKLKLPENIAFIFQPSHYSELNPIEQIWDWIKSQSSCQLFSSLEHLKEAVADILCNAPQLTFKSILVRPSILDALVYAGILK